MRAALLIAAGLLAGCGGTGPAPKRSGPARPAPVAIAMFYTSTPVVSKGEAAILCYGVANARELRLEPGGESLTPSPNRCIEVKPERSASYTLVARGAGGDRQSQTIEVHVQGTARVSDPAPAAEGVKIAYFRVEETTVEAGQTFHKLCFRAWNAEKVSIHPPAFPAARIFQGCFSVAPSQSTVYTITATGADGRQVTAQLTVSP